MLHILVWSQHLTNASLLLYLRKRVHIYIYMRYVLTAFSSFAGKPKWRSQAFKKILEFLPRRG